MNEIQNYGANVNFKSARIRKLNDASVEKMVADFNKKVMNTKFSGNYQRDMEQYMSMQAESNKILLDILGAAKEKTISYDCAKKQIKKLDIF